MRGYFAFPPTGFQIGHDTNTTSSQRTSENIPNAKEVGGAEKQHDDMETDPGARDTEYQQRRQHDEEAIRKRREKAKEIADAGEMEWVRTGGVLRDAVGRRDWARTESIRKEIKLREHEKQVTERWESYERHWRLLVNSNDSLGFASIPWPLRNPPLSLAELTIPYISDFLFEPLTVRSNTITKKERIRSSFLRWHPDKLAGVVKRVNREDMENVIEGINAVVHCLKVLQDTERAGQP